MNISGLRQATVKDHEAVEDLMPLMQMDLRTEDYVRYLGRMFGIVAAWEEQAHRTAPDWLCAILAKRERRGLLASDLACFGQTPSADRSRLPPFKDLYSLLGAMYVMEGSTLGGQLISRHVEKTLGFKAGFGDAYFIGHGEQTGRMWKEFCKMLETSVPECDAEFVILGAKAMFSAFGEWMRGIPATIDT